MSDLPERFPAFPKGTLAIFSATLINMLAVGAALPILPRYVERELHAGRVQVGLVIGAFAFAAIAARPFAGRFGDRRGRKPVMVFGTVLTAIAGAMYALPFGVAGLVAARVVLGSGEGVVYTSGAAWVADRASDANRGRLIGLFGLSIWGGVATGPLLGQVVFDATNSYTAVWALCALMPLASLAILATMKRGGRPVLHEAPPTGLASLLPKASIRPGLALMTANLGYAAVASFLVLMLDERGIGHGALAFGFFAAAVVLNRLLFGDLADRLGGRRGAMLASSVEAIGLLLFASAHSLPLALAAAVVMGSGFAMLFPSLALLVLADADPATRGAAMGTFTAFFDLGIAFGSPLVGVAAAEFGYGAAFIAGACGAGVGFLIAATSKQRSSNGTTQRRSGREPEPI